MLKKGLLNHSLSIQNIALGSERLLIVIVRVPYHYDEISPFFGLNLLLSSEIVLYSFILFLEEGLLPYILGGHPNVDV